jgi:plasmid stabilization system protein ParE
VKRVRWSTAAEDDLEAIHYYQFGISPGRVPGARELIVAPLPYLIIYSIDAESVQTPHIRHGARLWVQ